MTAVLATEGFETPGGCCQQCSDLESYLRALGTNAITLARTMREFRLAQSRGIVVGVSVVENQPGPVGSSSSGTVQKGTPQAGPLETFLFDVTNPIFGPQSAFGHLVQKVQSMFGIDPHTGQPTPAMAWWLIPVIVGGVVLLVIAVKVLL